MMYRLCMSALSMRTNPCTSVKSNRRQGNPTFRTKNNEQFIYQYSVAQEINPHHPVQVYSPLTTAGSSRAGSLALVWDPWEHPELGTSNLQHLRFFPAALACSHLRSPSVYRRTDTSTNLAVIRPTARSFKTCRYPRYYRVPGNVQRSVVSLSSQNSGMVVPTILYSTVNRRNNKNIPKINNKQKYKFFSFFYVRPCLVIVPFFSPNIYFVHCFFFFPVLPQWMSIAGSPLSPLPAGALSSQNLGQRLWNF